MVEGIIKVSIIDAELHEDSHIHLALVKNRQRKPEPWAFSINPDHPAPLQEIVELAKKYLTQPPVLEASFDFSKIERIAYETPVFLDESIDKAGVVESYVTEDKQERNCIRLSKRNNTRTLLHEIFHLCSDIPLKMYDSFSDEERAIEIAVEVAIRNDRKRLLKQIRPAFVKGFIDLFGLHHFSAEALTEIIEQINLYPYKYDQRMRDIARCYFLDELKAALSQQGDREHTKR